MPAWALIGRELRGMSRQGQLFWVRVIGAGLGIATMALLLVRDVEVGRNLGAWIFQTLNQTLTFGILLIGPVITADCIAAEKREGTLGLLFLAPISSRDIVLAKAVANAVRAFTLLLSVVPMMALPVVFGGVPGNVLLFSMLGQVMALCLALAAGILASTLHREFIQAAVWAVIYCILFVAATFLFSALFWPILSIWHRFPAGRTISLIISQLLIIGTGLLITWWVLRYATRNLKARWERESQDFKPPMWVRLFSDSELWRALLAWDTRKARSTHPIAWLQEYSWTARLAKWGWCALALFGELVVIVLSVGSRGYHPGHLVLAAMVALGIALAGANSFRTERLTGAIELLLVAPLSPLKLIGGRLWGIWVHFLPAVAIISFCWISAAPLLHGRPSEAAMLVSCYIFLPMIGLCISMLPWNTLVSWVAIYLVGAIAPFSVGLLLRHHVTPATQLVLAVSIQAVLGLASAFFLWHKLETRTFALPNSKAD